MLAAPSRPTDVDDSSSPETPRAPSFNLLIVEDDQALADLLARQLALFGHRATIVGDGRAALEQVVNQAFDLVILDRILPVMDGIALLQRMRQAGVTVPILMLTALGQSSNKVDGLNAGADDYLVKPVDPNELNARLHALHRARNWDSDAGDTLRAGDILVSPAKFRAWRAGQPMELPNIEFRLLTEFVRNAGTVLTRPMLLERVWQYDFEPTTNIVEAYIRRLRMKLTEHGDDPIITIRGIGYRLRD
ncbi:response regulator transcription factor [Sphingobium sp. H39-3-25]|uniref:response regulator transcription factor n=1 Tax=Sphingobium arseniciresistens TaxID=3030834 RepID=UPI0023B9AE14|nr:response regulator transcription factor [Sphingobium arseniciresistens]